MRSVSDELRVGATRRNRSIDHEITWLSLTGYCLRPGFGFVGDPERIDEAWRVSQLGLAHRNDNRVKAQWWIFWRRIAAGLSVEQQTWLFEQGRSALGKAEGESTEVYRLLGALERVDAGLRLELAERIVERMVKGKGNEAAIWAFGRLATRVPLYAEPQSVIPGTRIEASIQRVAELNLRETRNAPVLQALQVAAKYSPYDENNLSPALRMAIESKLREAGVREIELRRIREFVPLESAEQRLLFGEALPLGLVL